jgi:predicted dehydrogenase
MTDRINRRAFQHTALALGAASLASAPLRAAASERVGVGFIGLGNRGDQVLSAFLAQPDVDVVALCDVYEPYLAAALEKSGGKAKTMRDYRRLLELPEVQAVVISTPDHWHALQFVDACRAGKDVYVEKPLSLTVSEGRRMVDVARETARVTQMGVQRRSSPLVQEMVQLISDGAIGRVTVAKAYHLANEFPMGIGNPPDCDPPSELDWDLWLGPAPLVAYNPNRCLYKFRWFWNYSGGQVTNNGTHYLDLIQWALGQDAPRSVVAVGGKYFVADNREVPDTMEVVWEYPGDTLVTFSQYNGSAAAGNVRDADLEFRGTEGTLLLRGNTLELIPEVVRTAELPALSPLARDENRQQGQARHALRKGFVKQGTVSDAPHARNFLDCIKSREPTNCPVATGFRSTIPTLLANVSLKLGRRLEWDAASERFTDDAANRLLGYQYRTPWTLG